MRLLSMLFASAVLCSVAMAQNPPGVHGPERRPSDATPMEPVVWLLIIDLTRGPKLASSSAA